jgi:hypothetical protein
MKAIQEVHPIDNFIGFFPFYDQNYTKRKHKNWYIVYGLKFYVQDLYYEKFDKIKFQTEFVFEQKAKTITSKFDLKLQKFKEAKAKFNQLLPDLLKKYEEKYVAIIGDNIEIGDDKNSLFERINKKYGSQTMYLSKITKQKRVVRLRSPKLVKK